MLAKNKKTTLVSDTICVLVAELPDNFNGESLYNKLIYFNLSVVQVMKYCQA